MIYQLQNITIFFLLFGFSNVWSLKHWNLNYLMTNHLNRPSYGTHRSFLSSVAKSGFGFKPSDNSTATSSKTTTKVSSYGNIKVKDGSEHLLFPTVNKNYSNGVRVLKENPFIYEIDNFFEEKLCDDFIERAMTLGEKYDSQTFSNSYGTSSMRTSTTWYLLYKYVPELLDRINKLTGLPIENYEEPQIVRYEMGQQFSWHYDALPASIAKRSGGQRIATILVYLNTVDLGGATTFKDLKLQVKPVKGKALVFFPCSIDGIPDDRTMHAGQVSFDTKWIAQIWVRQSKYEPTIPPGNSHSDAMKFIG